MKAKLLFLVIFFAGAATAQEIFIPAPQLKEYQHKNFNFSKFNFDTGASGKNQIWDFSRVQIKDSSSLFHFQPIGDVPYKELFPAANMVYWDDNLSYFIFFHVDANSAANVGEIDFRRDSCIVKNIENKLDTICLYPLQYGKSWKGTRQFIESYDNSPVNAIATANRQYKVDGEGIIITPDNKRYDALRLRVSYTQEAEAFTFEDGEKIKMYHQTDEENLFKWLIRDMPFPFVFSISFSERTRIYPNDSITHRKKKSAFFYKPVLAEESGPFNDAGLVLDRDNNTSVALKYTLHHPAEGKLFFLDMNGRTVMTAATEAPDGNEVAVTKEINVENLVPGMYIITLIAGNEKGVVKWVKR